MAGRRLWAIEPPMGSPLDRSVDPSHHSDSPLTDLADDASHQNGPLNESYSPLLAIEPEDAKQAIQWLARCGLRHVPRQIDGDKDWGSTKQVWAGVKVGRDGWRLTTKRRYRTVEHGRWIQYRVSLPPASLPVQESPSREGLSQHGVGTTLVADIRAVEPVVGNQSQQDRWRIRSTVTTPGQFSARIQRWNRGVRLFSVTVEGRMRFRFDSVLTLALMPVMTEVPPALQFDPQVETAQLHMEGFEVDRISRIGGDVAEAWGEVLQALLVHRLVDQQNRSLTERINRSIRKDHNRMRVSLTDWMARTLDRTEVKP